jgi:hypothetical protein
MRLPPFWRPSKCTIQCRKAPDFARQTSRGKISRDEILCDKINQFARRHVSWVSLSGAGSGEVSDRFRVDALFGESATLRRSDTAAVTYLLNLPPDAGQQSRPDNGGQPTIVTPLTSNSPVPDNISGSFVRSSGRLRIPG